MNLLDIILLGVSLSMDACAVSITRGIALKSFSWKFPLITGLYFGVFQMVMPLLGYATGIQFYTIIDLVGHIIPPLVLGGIGVKMLWSALFFKEVEIDKEDTLPNMPTMLALAFATSVDAFAVGVTFIPLDLAVLLTSTLIGVTTFLCSVAGVILGHKFGSKYKFIAELTGAIILIAIGLRIFFTG